jgi:two-component system LytT family response regulator
MLLGLPHVSTAERRRPNGEPGALVHCYVADPDPFARHLLADAIARVDGALLIGATSDQRAMASAVRDSNPDVLFVHARMGADLLRARLTSDPAAPCCVVFVSAVAADAANAFTYDATDFVLKPFSRERIAIALERVRAPGCGSGSVRASRPRTRPSAMRSFRASRQRA